VTDQIDSEPIPPDDVLPCGCIIRCSIEPYPTWVHVTPLGAPGIRTLTYIPCRMNCPNYLNTLKLAHKADITVTRRIGK
jgi:hypothetical protein